MACRIKSVELAVIGANVDNSVGDGRRGMDSASGGVGPEGQACSMACSIKSVELAVIGTNVDYPAI